MLARIRKSENSEAGFTLIELLVVIIIIGILAAIAIPTFLRQREKGWQAAVKSDIANATIAEESYATDKNGDYTATLTDLTAQGFNETDKVTVKPALKVTGTASAGFTLCAVHTNLPNYTLTYDSTTGVTTANTTVGAACA